MDKQEQAELVDLASAHITQVTKDGKRGDWIVYKNITNETLFTFREHFNENQLFEMLSFARKYELIALNAGAEFERAKWVKITQDMERRFNAEKKLMRVENERLAEILDKHIREGK